MLSGVLKQKQTAGFSDNVTVRSECAKDGYSACSDNRWNFGPAESCGGALCVGCYNGRCSDPDIQMCPSSVAPQQHKTGQDSGKVQGGKPNAKPLGGVLGSEPISASFMETTIRQPVSIQCNYASTKDTIKTAEHVNTWVANFGEDRAYKQEIMKDFCAGVVRTCPSDRTECSRLLSTGEDGGLCRTWADKMTQEGGQSLAVVDSVKRAVCKSHPQLRDCNCINRDEKDDYNLLASRGMKGSFPDGCWWIPCKVQDKYLVPSEVLPKPGDCPENLCENVTYISDSEIQQLNLNQNVGCNFSKTGGPTADGGPTGDGNGGDGGGKFPTWGYFAIGGAVVFLVFLVLYFRSRGRPPAAAAAPTVLRL